MSYSYSERKPYVLSDEGQRQLLKLVDFLRTRKATTTFELMNQCGSGDTWDMLALVDRLAELGYIVRAGAPGRSDDSVFLVVDRG